MRFVASIKPLKHLVGSYSRRFSQIANLEISMLGRSARLKKFSATGCLFDYRYAGLGTE